MQTDGKYTFERVDVNKLTDYYIVFAYNGMGYENVQVNTTKNNGSKASENNNRATFNNNYQTISYGRSNEYTLDYDTRYKGESKLIYNSKERQLLNYGYSGNESLRDPITGVDSQYEIKAYTGVLSSLQISETNTNKATPENIIKNKITKIENINLGIRKRDKIDLSTSKELYQVAMNLNNETNYYNYTDRNVSTNRCTMAPQVKFGEETGRHSYSRGICASDIAYNGRYWGLSVYVTYKIRIENASPTVSTYINELTDYYDSKYTRITRVGIGKDSSGSGIKYTNENFEVIENIYTGNSEYKKATIRPKNAELLKTGGNQAAEIFVELQVDNSKLLELLDKENNSDEIVKLDNITEIASYSSKKGGQTYAAIDIDSQPGNLDISSSKTSADSPYAGDINTYEDDTDLAPGLKIVLQEERKIKGMVFEDAPEPQTAEYNPDGLNPNQIREGNGEYKEESKDKKLEGIKVRLVIGQENGDADTMGHEGETAKKFIYDYKTKTYSSKPIETETNENGEYELSGCLPGIYYVEYTWGDKTYRVQDYKNTIVDQNEHNKKTQDTLWYANEELDINARKSDALDDYDTRKAIDEQTKYMTYGSKHSIDDVYAGKNPQIKTEETTWEPAITQMKSKTPNFQMCFEYCKLNGGEIASIDEYETVEINGTKTLKIENGEYGEKYLVKKEGYKNTIKNIDFGIIERAKQVLELKKEVNNVKITLQNGTVLINAQIDENGKLKEKVKSVTFTPKSTVNGQLKAEMDSEIIQGAVLEIEYTIKVKNNSEIDFLNSNYYWFGSASRDEGYGVLLTPTKIIDYLDNNIAVDVEQDNVLNTNEIATLRGKGYFPNERNMIDFQSTVKNACLITSFQDKKLGRGQETKDEDNFKLKESRILSTDLIRNGIELENYAEIIQVNQTGGRPIKTTPGNYIPSDASTSEEDNAMASTVTVVPSTGLSVDYIAYTLLAISSLGILTAGIILIKKYIA